MNNNFDESVSTDSSKLFLKKLSFEIFEPRLLEYWKTDLQ